MTSLDFFLSFQATERMKIVDVLGAKQFSDGERIITQVRTCSWCGFQQWECDSSIGMLIILSFTEPPLKCIYKQSVFFLLRVTRLSASIL